MYEEFRYFCENLMSIAIEGLCDCVCVHVIEWLKNKVERCQLDIITQSQIKKLKYISRPCERTIQETETKIKWFRFICRVSSSYVVF